MDGDPLPGVGPMVQEVDKTMDIDSQPGLAPDKEKLGPIVEVAHGKDMWWSLPAWMSAGIVAQHEAGLDAGYTWDWAGTRTGSWRPEGQRHLHQPMHNEL